MSTVLHPASEAAEAEYKVLAAGDSTQADTSVICHYVYVPYRPLWWTVCLNSKLAAAIAGCLLQGGPVGDVQHPEAQHRHQSIGICSGAVKLN